MQTGQVNVVFGAGPPQSQKWRKVINAGQFLLRLAPWSETLIQTTIDFRSVRRAAWMRARGPPLYFASPNIPGAGGVDGHSKRPCNKSTPLVNGLMRMCKVVCCTWGDQGALMAVLAEHPEWAPKVQYVGFREFNSLFPFWAPGDLLVHFAAKTSAQRERFIAALFESLDLRTGALVRRLDQHTAAVKALAWCPAKPDLLATGGGSQDRCIRIFNVATGAMMAARALFLSFALG